MKIILLENGEPPRIETILNDNPAGELDELLGGPVIFRAFAHNLQLVTRRFADELNLPIRYRWDDGKVVRPIYGNCAIVRTSDAGPLCDVAETADVLVVDEHVKPIR